MADQMDLFELDVAGSPPPDAPLAHRIRPICLEEVVGQDHLLRAGAAFRRALEDDSLGSVILWGPPGCGKTSLALVVARYTSRRFVAFSAVTSGLPELRTVVTQAKHAFARSRRRTILFVDEIHRFNKTQQDGFLPHVEDGTLLLIGATTENPSFQLVGPLLSRCTVYPLRRLEADDVLKVIRRALVDPERGLGLDPAGWSEEALRVIAELADGDLRKGLNLLEAVAATSRDGREVNLSAVREVAGEQALLYDKGGEEHYNVISALHKCIRDSDVDSALYWLARMLESGEDPLYIARRLVRIASEDVGTAHPQALPVAVAAMHTVQLLGLPEADCALAEAVVYLALAPKSNRVYTALSAAKADARGLGSLPVPMVLRNAPTRLMDELGYGQGYVYAHDDPAAAAAQQHWPDGVKPRKYYRPKKVGWEGKLAYSEQIRNSKSETRNARNAGSSKHETPATREARSTKLETSTPEQNRKLEIMGTHAKQPRDRRSERASSMQCPDGDFPVEGPPPPAPEASREDLPLSQRGRLAGSSMPSSNHFGEGGRTS